MAMAIAIAAAATAPAAQATTERRDRRRALRASSPPAAPLADATGSDLSSPVSRSDTRLPRRRVSRIIASKVSQQPGKAPVSAETTGLDSAHRDIQPLSDLALREPLHVLQPDEIRLVGAELAERLPDLPRVIDPIHGRRQADQARGGRIGVLERAVRVAGFPAMDVDRRSPGDRSEPRPELFRRLEAGRRLPGLEECLLGRLLCQPPVAEHLVRDGEHEPPVRAIYRPYRVFVTCGEP